jgi:uncharacterized membrane protein YeaQ/YmgE (transglycosylase-associated protein family)
MPRLEEWPSSTEFGLQARLQFSSHRNASAPSNWLIVGALAKLIMPGKDPGGIIVTMLLGIAGARLAGWLGKVLGWYRDGQSAGFIASLIGALILLFIYRLFKRSHHVTQIERGSLFRSSARKCPGGSPGRSQEISWEAGHSGRGTRPISLLSGEASGNVSHLGPG